MNERQMQVAIAQMIRTGIVLACPNYTPERWWECDLWAVTRAGYPVEYEIKLSVPDFRADASKEVRRWVGTEKHRPVHQTVVKHKELEAGRGPSRFYFAVPQEMSKQVSEAIPAWAGLVVVRDRGSFARASVERRAPSLNRDRAKRREIARAQRNMVYRYWTMLQQEARA